MSNETLSFTAFRRGHAVPEAHTLEHLRAIKRAFVQFKTRVQLEIGRIEQTDADFEDKADLERDRFMLFMGACSLMQQIEQQAGMQRGELLTAQDLILTENATALAQAMGAEQAVANG